MILNTKFIMIAVIEIILLAVSLVFSHGRTVQFVGSFSAFQFFVLLYAFKNPFLHLYRCFNIGGDSKIKKSIISFLLVLGLLFSIAWYTLWAGYLYPHILEYGLTTYGKHTAATVENVRFVYTGAKSYEKTADSIEEADKIILKLKYSETISEIEVNKSLQVDNFYKYSTVQKNSRVNILYLPLIPSIAILCD